MIRHAGVLVALLIVPSAIYGDENTAKISDAVKSAKLSLETGLRASEREGRPISGKYELEVGKLQLSIYAEKAGKFYEVVVDHTTGKIARTEEITSGDDLTAAKEQLAAMAHAKRSLRQAVKDAQKAHKGFHTISVVPELKASHPIATITLSKDHETLTATEKLD
jgi:tryptophan synthase beta subunit